MNANEYEKLISTIAVKFTNNPLDGKSWNLGLGRANKIRGFSNYDHQIDVSLSCETDIVLIECKNWNRPIKVSEYLTLLGRVMDISRIHKDKRVRGALVTKNGWQSGVIKLHSAYGEQCSLFKVNEVGEIRDRIHVAFISAKMEIQMTMHAHGKVINKSS